MAGGCFQTIAHGLSRGIELWRVDLDAYPAVGLSDGLSADEVARAARQALDRDGRRLLAARHALRTILARATGRAAGGLVFEVDEFGKPRLPDNEGLAFNLSHSRQECLIATSAGWPIGVDVEVIHPVADASALARLHFTIDEQAELEAAADRDRAFLACWTRKEACVKALGIGLSAEPALIETGSREDCRDVSVTIGHVRAEVVVSSVVMPSSSVAAVAVTDLQSAAAARRHFARK
jgi:4'-phosphopantetheinyl transferase